MMRRRLLIATSAALAAAPLARSQSAGRRAHIGYLASARPDTAEVRAIVDTFRLEMQRRGWVEGATVSYDFRFADGVVERFAVQARELVALKPDLIVATSGGAADAAKAATSTIPVVFVAPDPVEEGLVASLARPSGNLTGLAFMSGELIGKQMQLLTDVLPGLQRVGYLGFNHPRVTREMRRTAEALRLRLVETVANRPEDLPRALASAPGADAWFVADHLSFFAHRRVVVDTIAAQRKPAVYPQIAYARAGGLMAYATDLRDLLGRAAGYADKILRGARPAQLPIEQPTKFELVVNLGTARALGLVVPQAVLLRATEAIE